MSKPSNTNARQEAVPTRVEDYTITTVWIYVDTDREVGDRDHLKVFANEDAAAKWFAENDPEVVAFAYPVNGAGEE